MRLTLIPLLVLCGFLCTGCESLRKTVHLPRKNAALSEQLANDQQRREATEKQLADAAPPEKDAKIVQQANLPATAPSSPSEQGSDGTLLKAKQAEQSRQNQVAKSLYEQVLQQQPTNAEAHHRLGVIADQDGRYQEAQQHYQSALQQQPQNASLLSDIGYSFYSQDRLDEAEYHLKAALQLQPDNQYARNNLAQVYGRRAQQTGSPADFKLAQEQFVLALGPQGAEQQMAQLFPQAGAPPREGLNSLNPFKNRGKSQNRAGSTLQAPELKDDGNAALARQMEEIRDQMIKSGEYPVKKPEAAVAQGAQRPNPAQAVPYSQMNDELSRIDYEASRQQGMALRNSYPVPPRGGMPVNPDNWNGGGNVEPASNWENTASRGQGQPGGQAYAAGGFGQRPNPVDQGAGAAANYGQYPTGNPMQPGAMGQTNGVEQTASWDNRGPSQSGQTNSGAGGGNQYGSPSGDPTSISAQGWNEGASDSQLSQTWPAPQAGPTQLNAYGQSWDGHSLINARPVSSTSGAAYEAYDPMISGKPYGAQRPGAASRPPTGGRGNSRNAPAGWDDGRQTAAQLGLDAGMGDMFPSGANDPGMYERSQPDNIRNNGWNDAAAGGNQTSWPSTDAAMYGNPTTPRGMNPGGTGTIARADYYSSGPGFQNNGYSQGVTPAMGENYGAQGGDVSAPWNQPGTNPRSGRNMMQAQPGNDAGQATGRFAPSRQASPPQNFGAPPMYYGR